SLAIGWISSRVGMRATAPLKASLLSDSQSGTTRLVAISRFFEAICRETFESFTSTTSFTFNAQEGMLTLRPFTLMWPWDTIWRRSEEHTSELQSRGQIVCRLLLETKKET